MDVRLLKYVYDAGRLYHRLLSPAREAAGLTQSELDILLFLANNPGYDTASDMVTVRRLAKSNVSVGVKSLEHKGYLQRRTDAGDRRVEHLAPTPGAARAIALGREGQTAFQEALTGDLSPKEREQLDHLLDRIHKNLAHALNVPEG